MVSTGSFPGSSIPCSRSCFTAERPSSGSRSSRSTRPIPPSLAGSSSATATGSTATKPPLSPSGAGSSGPMANHFPSESACDKPRGTRSARQLSNNTSAKPVRKRTEHVWTGWGRLRKLLERKPSKPGSAKAEKPPAVSRQVAMKQGSDPYPSGRAATPVAMDASEMGPKDPSANRRGTVHAPA